MVDLFLGHMRLGLYHCPKAIAQWVCSLTDLFLKTSPNNIVQKEAMVLSIGLAF